MRLVFCVWVLLLLLIGAAVFGAEIPPAPPEIPVDASFVIELAVKHPWIVTVLVAIASLRLLFKPVFTIWHAIVARTASTEDDAFLERVENSEALKWLLWFVDLIASIKLVKPRK
jgi:hypothetical protein